LPNLKDYRSHLLDDDWPPDWPSKTNVVFQNDVTLKQYHCFEALIEKKATEREIERCLRGNQEILSLTVGLFLTGTHASWIFPKEQIGLPSGPGGGLIPDYLLAGANSEGVKWFVLELKGADKRAFRKSGKHVSLSSDANRGICQLLSYIDLSSRVQAHLRDSSKLTGFREPRGIVLIGTEDESEDPDVREFKQAWNRINSTVQIRSHSSLLRHVEQKLRDLKKFPN